MKKPRKKRWVVTFIVTDRPKFVDNEFFEDAKGIKSVVDQVLSADLPAGFRHSKISVTEFTK